MKATKGDGGKNICTRDVVIYIGERTCWKPRCGHLGALVAEAMNTISNRAE